MSKNTDIIGRALEDFYFHNTDIPITIYSPDFDEDEILPSWYFRDFHAMPELEKIALRYCYGNILDVGAGAGSHSLILQKMGFTVSALDISKGACRIMKERGVQNVYQEDVFQSQLDKYDTVLMMMNGIGLCGNLEGLDLFLLKLKEMLNHGGQLIFDSSNLKYLFSEKEFTSRIRYSQEYYGEIHFQMEYLENKTEKFSWLFIDFEELSKRAAKHNFKTEVLYKAENLHYLARIFV